MSEEFKKLFSPYYKGEDLEVCWIGWNTCKTHILEILKKPLKNLDLSEDNCDNRYIDKIKGL